MFLYNIMSNLNGEIGLTSAATLPAFYRVKISYVLSLCVYYDLYGTSKELFSNGYGQV